MRAKKKLVVIGNGMAGARTVEEILARGGADQFDDRHAKCPRVHPIASVSSFGRALLRVAAKR